MGDRLLSKGLTPEDPDRNLSERPRTSESEEDRENERGTDVLVRTQFPKTLQAIGDNLDRALSSLQRMERKLGEFSR